MILHDWDDERATRILRRVREVIVPDGRLLVMEAVIPPGNAPSPGKLLDINMLVMTGGRERTRAEFARLFEAAGFEFTTVVDAHPAISIVEGRPVWDRDERAGRRAAWWRNLSRSTVANCSTSAGLSGVSGPPIRRAGACARLT